MKCFPTNHGICISNFHGANFVTVSVLQNSISVLKVTIHEFLWPSFICKNVLPNITVFLPVVPINKYFCF